MKQNQGRLTPRRLWLATAACAALMLGGCCKSGSDEPEPPAPIAVNAPTAVAPTPPATPESAVKVGTSVLAPWSRSGKMYGGTVTELYGKLGHVNFNDGDRGWALVEKMRPAGTPAPTPSDTCAFAPGDSVKAPWSRNKAMYSGIVGETHGKLALVNFLDGDKGWALCSEMQRR